MDKRKFEIGDKVKVKDLRIIEIYNEDFKERIGKIGTIQSYNSRRWCPYYVQFDDDDIEDFSFKALELEKVD